MVGQRIAHYEIIEKVGEGGMGVVYKARDHKADRFVALKLLTAKAEAFPEATHRLEQEALAVSDLHHPHIAAIHDRGEFDGKPYLVFEYLPGGSLREKLQQLRAAGERLPLDDVFRYGVEIGLGLAHAHRKGVVHRDVKPANVLLTADGSAKVSDFGLALWPEAARTTGAGKTLGTAAYTSPEQAQRLPVDHRSDIFSFGVLLYELAAGEPPFHGEYAAAVVYDLVTTPTPPLRDARPDAPEALDLIVQKATAKDPGTRYRHMGELLMELREAWNSPSQTPPARAQQRQHRSAPLPRLRDKSPGRKKAAATAGVVLSLLGLAALYQSRQAHSRQATGPAPPGGPAASVSVAVLPFENLSRNPEEDYLADGITEALITNLSKIPSLRVISRTSVMRYRNAGKTVGEIAKELNVTRIVEGSVLPAGGQIRVAAQLIDAASDEHIWAESYQRDLSGVLSLQQDVASAIADEVQIQLASRQPLPRGRTAPVNPAAYAAWIRGRILAYQWTPEGVSSGIASFQRAIDLDASYAPAYAGLAMAYGFQALLDQAPPGESWPRARAAAQQALELDPTLADAYTALGFMQSSYEWDWKGAQGLYQRALQLNPSLSDAHLGYAMTALAPVGRLDEALTHMQQGVALDPLSPAVNLALGHLYLFRRDEQRAIRQYHHAIELDPTFPEPRLSLALVYLLRGEAESAAAILPDALDGHPDREVLSHLLAGRREEALTALDRLQQLQQMSRVLYVSAADLAVLNLIVGRKPQALDWLEQGFRERATDMMFLKISPVYDPIRKEPRFQELLRRMSLT